MGSPLQLTPKQLLAQDALLEGKKLASLGKSEELTQLYSDWMQKNGTDQFIFNGYVKAKKIGAEDAELIAQYQKIADGNDGELKTKDLFFALGKSYDDLKQYAKSAAAYDSANKLAYAEHPFKRTAIDFLTKGNIDFFSKNRIAKEYGNDSKRPFFITGLPRSGTSLTEQILCQSDDIYGCGERTYIQELVAKLSVQNAKGETMRYPYTLGFMDKGYYAYAGENYLQMVAKLNPHKKHTVDKLPANYLYLGYIKAILPNSKIIHTLRDPRDTALSLYFNNFDHVGLSYANNWDEILFVLENYFVLSKFWREYLVDEIYELSYSKLVADIDTKGQELFAFCGLKDIGTYDKFHKIQRPVMTASEFQVRKPIYKSSSGKWQNYDVYYGRYFNQIAELAEKHAYSWE